ncbi:MAG: hypothetical protein AB7W16_00455 [Candidatus Obscuribacterales bacterium]
MGDFGPEHATTGSIRLGIGLLRLTESLHYQTDKNCGQERLPE